jgi:hypothetical protein
MTCTYKMCSKLTSKLTGIKIVGCLNLAASLLSWCANFVGSVKTNNNSVVIQNLNGSLSTGCFVEFL